MIAAAPPPAVRSALKHIPTVMGVSALARLTSCRVRIQWGDSWLENDDQGAEVLQVFGELPKPKGDTISTYDTLFRWRIVGQRVTPTSNWADAIQNRPGRIGVNTAMPC